MYCHVLDFVYDKIPKIPKILNRLWASLSGPEKIKLKT